MDKEKKSFKDTLNLPTTEFSIRANAKVVEPELLKKWQDQNLYKQTFEKNKDQEKFVFLDGPPYANGHVHMGTAFNKILKDIFYKSRRMMGYYVPFVPGWDCHGLPIEFKVLSDLGLEKDKTKIDQTKIKKACREAANKWLDVQRSEFKNLGVLANWDNPYKTMSPKYEANILRAFGEFVKHGYIERKGKTVPWCAHCQTTLATAEIEYKERKDPSCYVFFPLGDEEKIKLFPKFNDLNLGLLVWTTTPWTIPLNRAVVLNPSASYVLLKGKDEKAFIVGKELADKICEKLGIDKEVLAELSSKEFKGLFVKHPFIDQKIPILLNDIVTLEDGTACMHMAPGCGPEDYLIALKEGIEIFSPLTVDGKYSSEIKPDELDGMLVSDGQIWVIKKLAEVGNLIHKSSIRHSYPHCWRCRNGLIFRATLQWFCSLKKADLIERAIAETEKIGFIPKEGRSRLSATIGNRTEWCISRQRYWGVPITALICKECSDAYVNSDFISNIAEGISEKGIEYWDQISIEKMKQKGFVKDLVCDKCKSTEFRKETDILDVWFDSGVAHFAVPKEHPEVGFPSEIYLEATDQHRGWFQSSLLTSMILNNESPSKTIITHGFVVDEKGYKMSKSLGNVIAPSELIDRYSRDILRLWVAGTNYTTDLIISETVMKNAAEVYRKIRNTVRFLLSNLYDFDFKKDLVDIDSMLLIDRYALSRLKQVSDKALKAYNEYDTTEVFHTLNNYCANDLSAFYLDIIKDRLYVEKSDGLLRRSAQTVCYYILDSLTRLMAPILSFLAEESFNYLKDEDSKSIHLESFKNPIDVWGILKEKEVHESGQGVRATYGMLQTSKATTLEIKKIGEWTFLQELRGIVLKALEEKRAEGLIRHSLEAKVALYLDDSSNEVDQINTFVKELKDEHKARFFKDLFIVSQCEFVNAKDNLDPTEVSWVNIKVDHADGIKCPRCWQWDVTEDKDGLCNRCVKVLA